MNVQPYLSFNGCCEEAVAFYQRALGAKTEALIRHKDAPVAPQPGVLAPGSEDKVMHVAFKIGDATILATDGRCSGRANFQGFSLTITVPRATDVDPIVGALSDGGTVTMPATKTFWSPRFAMLTDRFGVNWMINAAA